MCGIVGMWGSYQADTLDRMLDSIEHRGPDGKGTYKNENVPVMMGSRRLSMVDLEGGDQPMVNETGDVIVVFNGEIYNHKALRKELEAEGHVFHTECDTEVLPHLWEEYDEKMVEKLGGMFAFSIWDDSKKQLFLARDRLGIKPLYFMHREGQIVWGSEMASLLATSNTFEVSERSLYNYFSLQYVPGPETLVSGVEKVPPGSSVLISTDEICRNKYWRLPNDSIDVSVKQAAVRIRELLEQSVQRRLMGDVPIGAFLSGGLDSSAVVGLLSEFHDDELKTFSVGFQGDEYDESDEAKRVANHFGTDHHIINVDLSDMHIFETLISRFGEPMADPSILPTLILSDHASTRVKGVLTGEGADELFAGYSHHRRIPRDRQFANYIPSSIFEVIEHVGERTSFGQKYVNYLAALSSDEDAIIRWRQGHNRPKVEEYLDTNDNYYEELCRKASQSANGVPKSDSLKKILSFEIKYWLPDDLLYKVDHSSMSSSLEARVPFLDHRLVEYVHNVPSGHKTKGGNYKPLLQRSVKDVVPDFVLTRNKHGFSVPISRWFRKDHETLFKWLTEDKISQTPYLCVPTIDNLLDEHRKRKADNGNILWKVINYIAWYEIHLLEKDSTVSI